MRETNNHNHDRLRQEIESLRLENARLSTALAEIRSRLTEPEEVIRAIRQGEIDALVIQEDGREEIYSLQRFDSVYRTVVERCFPYGVWLAKPGGTLLYVSPSFLDLLQTDLRTMRAKGHFHFLPPETREAVEREWAACRGTGKAFDVEYTVQLDDGSERTVWTQGILARTHDDQPHWVGVNIDVTERERTQRELHRQAEALRESEARYRAAEERLTTALSASDTGTFRWDPDTGTFLDFDDGLKQLLGRGPDDPVQTTEDFVGHVHPDDRAKLFVAVDRCRHGADLEMEFRVVLSSGHVRWLYARAKMMHGGEGRSTDRGSTYLVGACTDITKRKQVEETLREADRRKDEFLATLAHELRNPLAPIRTGLEVLKLAADDRELAGETRTMMEQQIEQMVRLIDDLLDVSRITEGKLRLRRERVELSWAVKSAVESTRPLMEKSAHELSVKLPPEPVYLDADPTRLAQIFANLLSNAAKYTRRGGHILLQAERQDGEDGGVVVSVRDDGIGIPAGHLPKLFEMFSQVDSALERSEGGLGIGLSLVRALVEMHGGTVEAHSDGLGKGSEFVVRLPVIGSEHEPPSLEEDGRPQQSEAKCRILVVDDNKSAAHLLATVLSVLGNEVCMAHDGLEAVQLAAAFRPRLVLLDIGMPKLNGYEAARRIREQPWGRDMILVALTGFGQEEDRQRAAAAGFDHHLTKPAEASTLQKLLAEDALQQAGTSRPAT